MAVLTVCSCFKVNLDSYLSVERFLCTRGSIMHRLRGYTVEFLISFLIPVEIVEREDSIKQDEERLTFFTI